MKSLGYLFCLLGICTLLYAVDDQSPAACLAVIAAGAWMIFHRKNIWSTDDLS